MAAMTASVATGSLIERKISPMPLITGALVLVFGGLTLWLANDTFIKIKPTILYAIFAAVLLGGLAMGRLFIKDAAFDDVSACPTGVARAHMALGDLFSRYRDSATKSSGAM